MNNFLILDMLHYVAFQRAVALHWLSQKYSSVGQHRRLTQAIYGEMGP